jgi:hypothetical protein
VKAPYTTSSCHVWKIPQGHRRVFEPKSMPRNGSVSVSLPDSNIAGSGLWETWCQDEHGDGSHGMKQGSWLIILLAVGVLPGSFS